MRRLPPSGLPEKQCLERIAVIYPGDQPYRLEEKIEVLPLSEAAGILGRRR